MVHNFETANEMLSKIQDGIGLNPEQVALIVISSLDSEYYTHLLIDQQTLMKWFTTDFNIEDETGR